MKKSVLMRDSGLFWLALCLTFVGLFFVFDAAYPRSIQRDLSILPREFLMQLLFTAVALAAGVFVAGRSPRTWLRASGFLWLLTVLALIAVEIPGIGYEMNGATRWIKLGPIPIQPAELAKVTLILYFAGVFANRKAWPDKIKRQKSFPLWMDNVGLPKLQRCMPGIWAVLALALIAMEPDLGTAAVLAVVGYLMCWTGGVSKKTMIVGTVAGLLMMLVAVKMEPYRMERIMNHFHRHEAALMDDIGFQSNQSELSMAGGGILGIGIGNGRAKHILPARTTDFIASTIAEETGFLGWLAVVGLLAALSLRLFLLAPKAPSKFGGLVLTGVGAWIAVQSVTNLLMANGTLPAIGIPLPFVSSGGSSLVALWVAIGMCQSALVPMPAPKKKQEEAVETGHHRWRDGRTRLSRA
ncbi:MAG: FtsW/RodA/SpoVE family cell cycle protein [Armatimonadetes bacterium]|nr:FtsW/RodA/SpoVE family cell cycle protein [Armatimonadota bacterium]